MSEHDLIGAWETVDQPFDGWAGERWELDADGTGRVISAGILITAGIVSFEWEALGPGRLRVRLEADRWRELEYALTPGEDGRPRLSEPGGDGFCGSDGPLVPARPWAEQ